MITRAELTLRACHLKGVLDGIHSKHSDFSEAYALLSPVIDAILQGNIPEQIPNQSFFFRLDQEHDALHGHLDLMNAIAKLDVGLEEFRKQKR